MDTISIWCLFERTSCWKSLGGHDPHESSMEATYRLRLPPNKNKRKLNQQTQQVRSVLSDLKLAIEGAIIMSPSLREAMDSMYDARVPKMWKQISWESSTLGFWFTELLERNAQFTRWCFHVSDPSFSLVGIHLRECFLQIELNQNGQSKDRIIQKREQHGLSNKPIVIHSQFLLVQNYVIELSVSFKNWRTGRIIEKRKQHGLSNKPIWICSQFLLVQNDVISCKFVSFKN